MTETVQDGGNAIEEYGTIDKSTWAEGPWIEEPDKVQWIDQPTGLDCLIVRSLTTGGLCGYVGVPEGHPLYETPYNKPVALLAGMLAERMNKPLGETPGMTILLGLMCGEFPQERPDVVFDVHGGLTYSDHCYGHICHDPAPGRPDTVWWFGFDCGHSGDYSPAMDALLAQYRIRHPSGLPMGPGSRDEVYRDRAYVEGEIARLAVQLAQVKRFALPAGAAT
jgi:hypothetical protein